MNADTYRTLAVVFLALAIILAVVAVVLFRKFNIPAVRDALTGKRAEREIAELRGVRAGSWVNAEEMGEGKRRKQRKKGVSASDSTTGTGTGTHDTSDIEFRPVTGTGSGTGSGSLGSASTKGGVTRPAADKPSAVPDAARSAGSAAKTDSAPVEEEDESTRLGTKAAVESVVEIPVSMASAAELADEGETALMQFRKTTDEPSDDDESRTILVRGGKKH
ncbi:MULTISPECIES: hypothetical protein [Bifidobacterium]|uniref:Uncharacterized protein n=2 Tax=Bifidobacterium TaxID=1678 RepID=A0A2M9HPD9_9BIFI|nr:MULTISPECIES: hypothetical protein [Bifidobacterium]NMM98813.1 hypothetical protein [Bifidobacterium sp. DSM 109959]PJM78686.1 hypothetical protein CUU80_08090 [Bifidobacterium scaligerum]